jgi:hypothetical protein
MYSARRSDYDVTNTVRVSSAADVRDAVRELFESTWPGTPFSPIARAFHDFEMAFTGRMPGYFGVDTVYHDQQHTLDVTLAMARLMAGYEKTHAGTLKVLGAERAAIGIFLALFHDIGYLRERSETARNGAEFTRNHVTRSARFMDFYLPTIGFAHWTRITSEIVHFTGYERTFEQIGEKVHDQRDIQLGHLLGTADMIAQMADRCYLEKCRDRLYPEFVLGGLASRKQPDGKVVVVYKSGKDLLSKTPAFYINAMKRLEDKLHKAYDYAETHFGGENPYLAEMRKNEAHINATAKSSGLGKLRRHAPHTLAKGVKGYPETLVIR